MATSVYPNMGGAVDNTSAAKFIPEIWSDEVIAAYKSNLVMANLVKKMSMTGKKGDTIHVPKPVRGDAHAKAENTAVTVQNATDDTTLDVVTDDRPEVKSDDLKLELYNQFKIINDRWVSGTNLTDQTLFEKFLFLDRANQDIGDEAIINIWDILKLDSPFTDTNSKTLTQSVSSYLSIILANNYFNFIPLPSYINFFNVEKKGTDTQAQGNAMLGTFKTVDYIDSAPAFLCQYVGKPSSQLNAKTPNNGYNNDSFNYNSPNSPLVTQECGNKEQSNKVMGFNVDFGIPNQNIFESITLVHYYLEYVQRVVD